MEFSVVVQFSSGTMIFPENKKKKFGVGGSRCPKSHVSSFFFEITHASSLVLSPIGNNCL
jgi:hypothetical protein